MSLHGGRAARGAMRSAARRPGPGGGLASEDFCSSLHHLISGRIVLIRTHLPLACGEEGMRMRPIYETAWLGPRVARSSSVLQGPRLRPRRACYEVVALCLHCGSLGNKSGGEIAPQGDDQLARQRDDGDAPGAFAGIGRAREKPAAEPAVRLMAEPEPGQFDRLLTGAPIAGLADALLAVDAATLPGTGRQSAIACDLTPVAEILVEHLVHQRGGERRTKRLEPLQEMTSCGHLRGSFLGWGLLEGHKLLTHLHQPRVLALDLG